MCISELSGCDLIALSGSIAISISQNLTANEISTLAAFFTTFGDNLALIAVQKSLEDSKKDTSTDVQSDCIDS